MTNGKTFLFFVLIMVSVAGGFLLGQQNDFPASAQKKSKLVSPKFDLINKIKGEKIREFRIFEDGENEFYAVIRETDEPVSDDSIPKTSDQITIYDENGKAIYEYRDAEIGGLEFKRLLKSDSKEFMFSGNGGGTDNFLKILSYKNGKFTEIIDEAETVYRGGYFTMPQYRSDMKTPYFKPSQMTVIRQIGGADENPSASVFRTKDNKFQRVGEIKMRELGDFIENQIVKSRTAK